jgi:hypothetical protein
MFCDPDRMLHERDIPMTSGNQNAALRAVFTLMMFSSIFPGFTASAQARESTLSLSSFIHSVRDGDAKALRGVYVRDVIALPIVQQAGGNAGYVSNSDKVLTQFNMAAEAGNVGLLAHNYLAGAAFSRLAIGQVVNLVYGNGRVESFIVTDIQRYQALDPYSTTSDFRDLDTNTFISADELFSQVYRGDRHVTFQTCIESNGNASWGRLFIIAEPRSIVNERWIY